MEKLNIVMLEPEIPQNTGNIGRTCAATGSRLHLIEPMGFKITDKYLKRASMDYWYTLDVTVYKNIEEFFQKNEGGNFYYFSTKARKTYCQIKYPENTYLIFGKETAGIPEELLLKNPDTTVRIPMLNNARSLNLSNSVAIAAYEVLRQKNFKELSTFGNLHNNEW